MRQAPGLQVASQENRDPSDNQSTGMTPQQSQFHRAQSVTSAVDYEYFDVGIGQVAPIHTCIIICAWEVKL